MTSVSIVQIVVLVLAAAGALWSAIAWGLFRRKLFDLVPVARDVLVDNMSDAVIVLDRASRIIDINHAGRALIAGGDCVGREIDRAIPWWTPAQKETPQFRIGNRPVVVTVQPGPRYLEVRTMPVRDRRDYAIGTLVCISDVTARHHAEAAHRAFERRLQERQKLETLTV